MVQEAKLLEHLQLVRDYYALGRGEVFQRFITVIQNQLGETSLKHVTKKLNFIFTELIVDMYGENEKSYQKFELTLPKFETETGKFSCQLINLERKRDDVLVANIWTELKLNFNTSWPLHIIFHPKMMEHYNKIFSFLLYITKTQKNLNELWLTHMCSKKNV